MRRGVDYTAPKQREAVENEEYMSAEAAGLSVGERCEVDPGSKRGVIRSSSHISPSECCDKPLAVHIQALHKRHESVALYSWRQAERNPPYHIVLADQMQLNLVVPWSVHGGICVNSPICAGLWGSVMVCQKATGWECNLMSLWGRMTAASRGSGTSPAQRAMAACCGQTR